MKYSSKREILLSVKGLTVEFRIPRGILRAVDNVYLDVYKGEVLGLAGESGCGKSVLAHAILNIVDPNGYIKDGKIIFRDNGKEIDILSLPKGRLRRFRWEKISIVFQGAQNSFNPVIKIKDHFIDTVVDHRRRIPTEKVFEEAEKLLKQVRLDANQVLGMYQHEMSGGMKQRALMALSFILKPKLIILDEPTSALDVLTQKYIVSLLKEIHEKTGVTMIFITHDLPVLAEIADRIAIMYLGNIVEIANVRKIFYEPKHPYTQALLKSIPSIVGPIEDLQPLPGPRPDPVHPPPGCKFHPRCPHRMEICTREAPKLVNIGDEHYVACHLYQ
ncbi:MAG: ABC transporter ATP-binding protein [Thermoprotei archaeon]|nr:MAG: ABC transporter ATP-binding protein [Thermoprotei archaeon]